MCLNEEDTLRGASGVTNAKLTRTICGRLAQHCGLSCCRFEQADMNVRQRLAGTRAARLNDTAKRSGTRA